MISNNNVYKCDPRGVEKYTRRLKGQRQERYEEGLFEMTAGRAVKDERNRYAIKVATLPEKSGLDVLARSSVFPRLPFHSALRETIVLEQCRQTHRPVGQRVTDCWCRCLLTASHSRARK